MNSSPIIQFKNMKKMNNNKRGISLVEVTITISVISCMLILYKFVLADIVKEVGFNMTAARYHRQAKALIECTQKYYLDGYNNPHGYGSNAAGACVAIGHGELGDYRTDTSWPGIKMYPYYSTNPDDKTSQTQDYWQGQYGQKWTLNSSFEADNDRTLYLDNHIWTGFVSPEFCRYFNKKIVNYDGIFYDIGSPKESGAKWNPGFLRAPIYCTNLHYGGVSVVGVARLNPN